MSSIVETACALAERGYYVFPVKRDKKPLAGSHGYKDATCDPQEVRKRFFSGAFGIGLACGASNLFVFDVDCKEADGFKSLEALEKAYQPLPATVWATTPSGGHHYYFRGEGKSTSGSIAPGIDTRAEGGYVIVPPSVAKSRDRAGVEVVGPYEWQVSLLEHEPAPVPKWLKEISLRPGKQGPVVLQGLIPEGTRNTTLFKAACDLRGKGWDEGAIQEELERINEERCEAGLPPQEVATIARSAASFPTEREKLTTLHPEACFEDHELEAVVCALAENRLTLDRSVRAREVLREASQDPFKRHAVNNRLRRAVDTKEMWEIIEYEDAMSEAVSWEGLLDEELAPRLVERLLPLGSISLLAAKPGVGKSTLVRTLVGAVVSGGEFLGRKVLEPGPVVYYALEEDIREVGMRLKLLGLPEEKAPICLRTARGMLLRTAGLRQLARDIAEYQPKLIVIDTLPNFLNVENGNDYSEVQAAMRALAGVIRESKAHCLGVMHANKNGNALTMDAMLGSTAWMGSADVGLAMARGEGVNSARKVSVTKCRPLFDEAFENLEVAIAPNGAVVIASPKEERRPAWDGRVQEVVQVLQEQGPMNKTELAKALGGRTQEAFGLVDFARQVGAIDYNGNTKKYEPLEEFTG